MSLLLVSMMQGEKASLVSEAAGNYMLAFAELQHWLQSVDLLIAGVVDALTRNVAHALNRRNNFNRNPPEIVSALRNKFVVCCAWKVVFA